MAAPALIRFTIPGRPVSWKRVKRGRYGQVYDPNVKIKRLIGFYALKGRVQACEALLKCPVALRIEFLGPKYRADVDNLAKLILDALNGVIYADDSQVISLEVAKRPAAENPETRVEVRCLSV